MDKQQCEGATDSDGRCERNADIRVSVEIIADNSQARSAVMCHWCYVGWCLKQASGMHDTITEITRMSN